MAQQSLTNVIINRIMSPVDIRIKDATGRYTAEVNSNNALKVAMDSSSVTIGDATAAKQDAQTALLTTIDADTSKIPTDPAKESGKLTTIDSTLTALGALVTTLNGLVTAIKDTDGIKQIVDAVAVTGTFWQATQPVSGPVTPATTITEYSVTLTNVDTEYSQAIPDGTKKIFYMSTSGQPFRAAYATGKVATPTQPYEAVGAGVTCSDDGVSLTSKTIYFATDVAGDVIFLRCWT